MADNLFLGPEAEVNHGLGLLRAATFEKAVAPRVELVPGAFLSVDAEAAVSGMLTSVPGSLLSLRLAPNGPTRWISLHLRLGAADFRQVQMIGAVCKAQSPRATTFRMTLRSGVGAGFVDTLFRKTVVAYAEPSVHMDALDLTREPGIPREAPWREVILMFELAPIDINLLNFGIFSI